jgi:hypothetical protein
MNDQFHEFSGTLPKELLGRAYRSTNELAWNRADAVEAIDRLEKAGFTVLGVEVWLPTSPGPTMTGRSWDTEDSGVSERPRTARDFVKNFKWGEYDKILKDREPFFNLTVTAGRN